MGITIHDSKGEEYVVEHDVSPYTLLEDDAPSKIDIQHVDRATSTTGTTPSNSTHPFLHPRVRVLIAGFSGLVVAAAVVVISVRSSRGSTPVASPYVRFGSHHDSEKARSNLFHDIVRDANAIVGQADDEFVTSSNENVDPLLNAKKTLLSDIIRDANMVIGQGDDELIGSHDANEEVLSYEILSSDDRHPEPKTFEEKQQIYDEIVRDVANIIGQGDDEFVDQSVRSSADSRQEGMNHETIALVEQFKRHNEIVRDAKKAIGQGDDEFDYSHGARSVDSSEEYRTSNETSSMRTHPEPKILAEEKFEMNQDFVRDASNAFGNGDDLFQPTTTRGSVDSSNTFVHGDDLFLESMESDDRHPEPKSLSEAIEIYHDIVRDARSTIGQGDDEYIPGSSRYSDDESLMEQDRSYDDDLIESNNRQYSKPKTLVEKFVLYNNIVRDAEQAVGQGDDDDEFVVRNGSLMTEGKEDR